MNYIKEIEKCTKKKAKIKFKVLQKGDVQKTYADIKLLFKRINFKPKVTIQYGISEFIKWYKGFYKI